MWNATSPGILEASAGQIPCRDAPHEISPAETGTDQLRKGGNQMDEQFTGTQASTSMRDAGTPALEAIDITKSLPLGRERIAILKGITLRIAHGELVAIVGPSGSGKSTLLGIIAGLDSPTAGRILVDGADITRMSEAKLAQVRNASIGMVFQAFNLIPTLTAQENVEVPLYVGRHRRPPLRARQRTAGAGRPQPPPEESPQSAVGRRAAARRRRPRAGHQSSPSSSWTSRPATSTRRTATTCCR